MADSFLSPIPQFQSQPRTARIGGEEDRLTLGSGGAAGCEVQGGTIYMQARMPAGCKELPEASVRLAEADQGEGPGGVPADEAALVVRAKGGLGRETGPDAGMGKEAEPPAHAASKPLQTLF